MITTTTMECCIAYLCSLFSEVVHYRKSMKQRKPKAAIKGACHRFSKSVSVDGQKNADKNWPVQPYYRHDGRVNRHDCCADSHLRFLKYAVSSYTEAKQELVFIERLCDSLKTEL